MYTYFPLGILIMMSVAMAYSSVIFKENSTILWGLTGQLSGTSTASKEVAAGIRAAFLSEGEYSRVNYTLIALDDGSDPLVALDNFRSMKAMSVFGYAGIQGSDTNQRILPELELGTPYVAPFSGSSFLRSNITPNVASVFNLFPSDNAQIELMLKYLAADWDVLKATSIVYENDVLGQAALDILTSELSELGMSVFSKASYDKSVVVNNDASMRYQVQLCLNGLMTPTPPRAVIYMGSVHSFLAEFVRAATERYAGFGDNPPTVISSQYLDVDHLTEELSVNQSVLVVSSAPLASDSSKLVQELKHAMQHYFPTEILSPAMIQGFMIGRTITDTTQEAVDHYGWPLTRQNWIDALTTLQGTIDLGDWSVGPWTHHCPTVLSTSCWCNEGVRELFLSRISSNGIVEEPTSSSLVNLCSSVGVDRKLLIFGQTATLSGAEKYESRTVRTSIQAALDIENNQALTPWSLTVASQDDQGKTALAKHNANDFLSYGALGVVGTLYPDITAAVIEALPINVPLIGAFSGLYKLKKPFVRKVINLRASSYDETNVIVKYLSVDLRISKIAVIHPDNELGLDYKEGMELALKAYDLEALAYSSYDSTTGDTTQPSTYVVNSGAEAFVIVGTADSSIRAIKTIRSSLPAAVFFLVSYNGDSYTSAVTKAGISFSNIYCTQILPQRQEGGTLLNEEWRAHIPADDQTKLSYAAFFLGKFLTSVLAHISEDRAVTSATFLNTLYSVKVFDVGGIPVGPFSEFCKDDETLCCNQGLSKIWITKGDDSLKEFPTVKYNYTVPFCGVDYTVKQSPSEVPVGYVAGPTVALGVVALIGVVAGVVVFRTKEGIKDLEVDPEEVQFLAEIGVGRYGKVFMATWKGTDVAVRIVNLTTAVADGTSANILKEEVFVMKRLRHPSIVMILGYFQRPNEFCILTEFMQMGSLERMLTSATILESQTLLSMAADVCRGAYFLHHQTPPIIHGSLTTACVMVDAKLTAKITDVGLNGDGKIKSRDWHGRYSAPELYSKDGQLTPQVDVFSFGIMLWEMFIPKELLVNYLSTHSKSAQSKSHNKTNSSKQASEQKQDPFETFSIPATVPPGIGRMIRECTTQDPDGRPTFHKIMQEWNATIEEVCGLSYTTQFAVYTPSDSKQEGSVVQPPSSVGSTLTSFDVEESHTI